MGSYKLNEDAVEDFERLFDYGIDIFGLEQAKDYSDGLRHRFLKPHFFDKRLTIFALDTAGAYMKVILSITALMAIMLKLCES